MHKPSKQTVSLVVAATLISLAGGAGATYYLLEKNDNSASTVQAPSPTESPVELKPDKSKENKEATVAEIARDPGKFAGLQVIAVGKVSKVSDRGEYLLVSDEEGNQATLTIDSSSFNGKLDEQLGKKVKLSGKIAFISIDQQKQVLGIKESSVVQ